MHPRYDKYRAKSAANISRFAAVSVVGLHRHSCRVAPPNLFHGDSLKSEGVDGLRVDPKIYDQLVKDGSLPNGAFRLWHAIRSHADDKGIAFPSVRTLQKYLHCDYRTFKKWLALLIERKLLSIHQHGNTKRANRYKVSGCLLSDRQVSVKLQTGCLANHRQNLIHKPNPQFQGEGRPRGLSASERISKERECDRIDKYLEVTNSEYNSPETRAQRKAYRERKALLKSELGQLA